MAVDVTLIINAPDGTRQITLPADRLTIGRTELSSVVINDEGLSRLHASINREGDRVWILDENSTNGSFVNNAPVPPAGVLLRGGDQISIGNHTTIQVLFGAPVQQIDASRPQFEAAADVSPVPHTPSPPSSSSSNLLIVTACVVVAVFLIGVAALGARAWRARADQDAKTADEIKRARLDEVDDTDLALNENSSGDLTVINPTPAIVEQSTPLVPTSAAPTILSPTPQSIATVNSSVSLPTPIPSFPGGDFRPPAGGRKLYVQMSEDEKMQFIEDSAQHVSTMMGNRPYAFTPEVLKIIKGYVDGYARRVGNNSTRLWGEDMRFMFARAREQFSPYIVQAFNRQGVPPVVGLYLCVIETEYHNIPGENMAGAAGLFQFIGPTAEAYGVPRAERTNVEKMAPAAARYISHRIAEFGTDSMSVALGIAGYNRNPDSVRRDLRDVLNSENKERSFWTLVANSDKLDHWFQGENIKYVPKFFAAAIVGEYPWAFNLEMRPLSTYTDLPPKQTARQTSAAVANSAAPAK